MDFKFLSNSIQFGTTIKTCITILTQHQKCLNRSSKERAIFTGLLIKLSSPEFLLDLGLMFDVLFELSLLSEYLQNNKTTIYDADKQIRRTIRIINSFKEKPSEKYLQAQVAQNKCRFEDVQLRSNKRHTSINRVDFLEKLVKNYAQQSKFQYDQLINIKKILDPFNWKESEEIASFGQNEIKFLAVWV